MLNEPVLMYCKEDGDLVAMDNRCPHRMAPLSGGQLFGDDIQCSYHGLRFGPGGTCVRMSSGVAPPRATLKVYPVVERHALVCIWMGEVERADPALMPDYTALEDPGFVWFGGYLYAAGNYQLMVDNLLDLSHSEFLHPMLSSEGWTARNEQSIKQDGTTITVNNIVRDDNILSLMAHIRPDLGKVGTTVQMQRWDMPSWLELSIEYYSATTHSSSRAGTF